MVHSVHGVTLYFTNNSVENRPIFVIIGTRIPEDIRNHTVVMLPTSREQCLYAGM